MFGALQLVAVGGLGALVQAEIGQARSGLLGHLRHEPVFLEAAQHPFELLGEVLALLEGLLQLGVVGLLFERQVLDDVREVVEVVEHFHQDLDLILVEFVLFLYALQLPFGQNVHNRPQSMFLLVSFHLFELLIYRLTVVRLKLIVAIITDGLLVIQEIGNHIEERYHVIFPAGLEKFHLSYARKEKVSLEHVCGFI